MRRAYLKGYDMGSLIKTKRALDKAHIPEEHMAYFDYRRRGNSWWDPYLEAKFPSKGQISKERQACIDKMEQLIHGSVPELNVVVQRGGITKTIIRMFYSSDYTNVFFIKEDYTEMVFLKSGVYGSKERAMFNLKNNSVNWFHRTPIQ
jgi:hypothetical protein